MSRGLVFVLVAVLLLGASVASASDWYVGARFGGMSNYWLYPHWYDDDHTYVYEHLEHTDYGIFDFREMTVGLRKGVWAGELGFGMSSGTWTHDDEYDYLDDYYPYEEIHYTSSFEEKVTWRVISLAGLYRVVEPDPIELDVGLRFQLHSATFDWEEDESWEYETGDDYTRSTEDKDKVSGWSLGPLVRARWYFADGALAIGPEIYVKYTSLEYEWDRMVDYDPGDDYDDDFTSDITHWGTEYSFRLEMFF